MSSSVFNAKSSHRADDPQLCGLCDFTGCAPIMKGESCLYLTCLGNAATTATQVERSGRADNYATGFRTVPSGQTRLVSEGTRFERRVPVFKWQQQRGDAWIDVVVWERLVHAACARRLGYRVSGKTTEAIRGRRTQGHAHVVADTTLAPAEPVAVAPTPAPVVSTPPGIAAAINAETAASRQAAERASTQGPSAFVRAVGMTPEALAAREARSQRAREIAARNRVGPVVAVHMAEPEEKIRPIELDDGITVPEIEDTAAIERFRHLELD